MIFRLFDVFMMFIMFQFRPEQVYRFSTMKRLLPLGARYPKDNKPGIIPFNVINNTLCNFPKMEEINICMRGSSFDLNKLINTRLPVFLVNYIYPKELVKKYSLLMPDRTHINKMITDHDMDVTFVYGAFDYAESAINSGNKILYTNVHYLNDDYEYCPQNPNHNIAWQKKITKNKHIKIIPICYNVYPQPNPVLGSPGPYNRQRKCFSHLNLGSGLAAISALYPFAEKINVYGWDFYLDESPNEMNYMQFLSSLYKYKYDKRTYDHFESALLNVYYVYHLSKLPNINIFGNLNKMERHKKIINRIERVLYN